MPYEAIVTFSALALVFAAMIVADIRHKRWIRAENERLMAEWRARTNVADPPPNLWSRF